MKKVILVLVAFCSTTLADGRSAPFGMSWGAGVSEVRKLGVVTTQVLHQPPITIYSTKSLPKNLSISKEYLLAFTENHGLQKITMTSTQYTDDIYGTEGKKAYLDLKNSLIAKYGDPVKSAETVGHALYKDADEFYQCLGYAGCGFWFSSFDIGAGKIGLRLHGQARGRGEVSLGYEGPRWSEAVKIHGKTKAASDEGAL